MGADGLKQISYPDPARPANAFETAAARSFDRSHNPAGMKRQLLAIIADGSRVARLKKITAPTLVIHGAADPLVPMAGSQDITRHVPGARLEIVEKMGHDLPPSQVPHMVSLIAGHADMVR
jgi:pimeloyl-ACP methyl ester carboxylesterase